MAPWCFSRLESDTLDYPAASPECGGASMWISHVKKKERSFYTYRLWWLTLTLLHMFIAFFPRYLIFSNQNLPFPLFFSFLSKYCVPLWTTCSFIWFFVFFHASSFSWCRYPLSRFCNCCPLLLVFNLSSFGLPVHLLSLHVLVSISNKIFSLLYLFILFPCLPFSGSFYFFPSLFLPVTQRSYRSRCFPPSFLFGSPLSTCVLWYLMCFLNRLGLRLVYLCIGFCPFLFLREL
jgi:hypothetical protein